MSPVIRLSDSTYKRLELHAIGFDAPNNVIERLIDFYESHQNSSQKSNSKSPETSQASQLIKRTSPSKKKPRDVEREKQLKKSVGENLRREHNWGKCTLKNTVLEFHNSESKVLCKYSSKSENGTWFWGVGIKYWSEWDDNNYLALLMENEDQVSYSFLFLKSKDAIRLFERCGEDNRGEKKINLRLYKDGRLHFQDWQDYDVRNDIRKIKLTAGDICTAGNTVGLLLEDSEQKENERMEMGDEIQLKTVRELYSELVDSQFSFMGKGEFHIQKIYSAVKKRYPHLCDDSLMCHWCCKGSKDTGPEWQHRVRTVLGSLKDNGEVKKGNNRGYWIFYK